MKRMFVMAALAAGAVGCGGSKPETADPKQATAEQEAEQRRAEKDVQNAESAERKANKATYAAPPSVEEQERARQR